MNNSEKASLEMTLRAPSGFEAGIQELITAEQWNQIQQVLAGVDLRKQALEDAADHLEELADNSWYNGYHEHAEGMFDAAVKIKEMINE